MESKSQGEVRAAMENVSDHAIEGCGDHYVSVSCGVLVDQGGSG